MDRRYNTVILAALLHDIGKFYQKGDCRYFGANGKHPEVSARFIEKFGCLFGSTVDVQMLGELVQKHHENAGAFPPDLLAQNAREQYRAFAYMICCADNFSSKERGEESEDRQNYRTRPLASIFGSISTGENGKPCTGSYRPVEFDPEGCFPDSELVQNLIGKNSAFIDRFSDEIDVFSKSGVSDFNTLYTVLNSLLLKYLWCIPSSSFDRVPDVSLYDHLRTTSAISACLYRYHAGRNDFTAAGIRNKDAPKFKLVLGDFSGIQNYIFGISASGAGGIAKRLRARSFFVNILLEVISHYICHVFDVPLNNILIASGGKFYVLLPNIEDSDALLMSIVKETDAFLYRESSAEVSINIAVEDICGSDFDNFDRVIGNLNRKLGDKKVRKYESVLKTGGKWKEIAFEIFDDLDNKTLCRSCGKVMVDRDSGDICGRCMTDVELGQALANAKYVCYGRNTGGIKVFKDYSIDVSREIGSGDYYMVALLNSCSFMTYKKPVSIKYMANHIPVFRPGACHACEACTVDADYQPLSFECLARNSTGRKLLGIYKADVDNLGFLFMEGLKRDDGRSKNTVSRIATFSRMLEMFFSGYIDRLIDAKYPLTYCVFSGGDDLFLAGPWDSMIDMSMEINRKFGEYTAGNNAFALSSAVIAVKPKYPLSKAADDVEDELELSKNRYDKTFYMSPKNQMTFLSESIKWDDFEEFIRQGRYIEGLLAKGVVKTAQIRRLADYSSMYRRFLTDDNASGLRFLPMLSYDIARNYGTAGIEQEKFRKWVLNLRNNINKNKYLYYLNIIARYALMKTRGKGGWKDGD